MLIEVKVPQLSESVAEATLAAWHVQEGDAVARDQNLIDIETDKVVLELPAPSAGVITKIIKRNGDSVVSGEVIAQLDTEAKANANAADKAAPPPAAAAAPTPVEKPAAVAMPAARKLMEEKNLSPGEVQGSGRGGRILKEDVAGTGKPAAATAPSAAVSPAPTFAPPAALPQPAAVNADAIIGNRPEQRVPMSRLRARVAERLLQSQATNAILTTFNEVNMAPVIDLRKKYQEKFEKEHGVKLGFMSFFTKAACQALKVFPLVNASIDGRDVVHHDYYDIGVAVSSERGLVVPILRNADRLSFAEIEKQIADFGRRANSLELTLEEMEGGTFTISNGGVFGSLLSTPILNPPQSGVLGLHKIQDRPVAENGQVVIRPMMYVALTYDHRIIDGREAVSFLRAVKDALEDPARLLLEL